MILPLLLSQRRKMLLAGLIAIGTAQASIGAAGAWLIKTSFDKLQAMTGASASVMAGLAAAFLLWASLAAILRMAERRAAERLGQDYVRDIRLAVYDHMVSLSPRALRHRSHGGIMLRFVGDLTAMRQWVSLGLSRLVVAAAAVFGAMAFLFYLNVRLALTISTILAASLLVSVFIGERMRQASLAARQRVARLAANINEKIASMSVVQAFGQAKRERRRIAKQSQEVLEAMVSRAGQAGQLRAITDVTIIASYGGMLLVGAREVAEDRASVGIILAAMTILGMLMPILAELGRVGEYWQNAKISRQKVEEFLQIEGTIAENTEGPHLLANHGLVEFDNVCLGDAITKFTATASPGKVILIIGPSGAGKSTLLALAARLIEPTRGAIRIDGQDIQTHTLESVRKAIGIVAPDLPLLRGTIERNLRYRCPDASAEEMQRVRQLCKLDGFLITLPDGEATRISEGGKGLSSGEQQKIALARAILGQPKILLLDEADANFDAEACAILEDIISKHEGTTLMITHRVDRLSRADLIWYMENGRLVEAGTLQALLEKGGAAAQFLQSALHLPESALSC
jgi:ABC-type multidrug transport system fused ATPase/permease subunit